MRLRYIPVGKTVEYESVTLEAVAVPYNKAECTGCVFTEAERRRRGKTKISCYTHRLACTKYLRKDRRHVIFKEVEEKEKTQIT